jgi:hypothetical protein
MKLTRIMLALATVALGVASAANPVHFTVIDPEWLDGNQLKPGDYTVQIEGDRAVIKSGKNVVEVPAKLETAPAKFDQTSLFELTVDGKSNIEEIRVGGSHTRIVFESKPGGAASQ